MIRPLPPAAVRPWLAAAVLALALGLYVLVAEVVPRAAEAAQHYRAWQTAKIELDAAANWQGEVTRLDGERAALQREFSARLVGAPGDERISAVLRGLRDFAEASDADLVGVEPLARADLDSHEEVRIRTGLSGSYHAVARFVSALEHSSYRARVARVRMSADGLRSGTVNAVVDLDLVLLNGKDRPAHPAPISSGTPTTLPTGTTTPAQRAEEQR